MSDVRVLVVDDSPTVRAVLRRILTAADGVCVVGEAGDGEAAIRATLGLSPDVVLMDVEMPRMDGYAAIVEIMAKRPTPIVVLSSRARRDQMLCAFEAMQRGAVAVLAKPGIPAEWDALARELTDTVRHLSGNGEDVATSPQPSVSALPVKGRVIRYLAVGASTGGPAALRQLLGGLGAGFGAGVVVVQHISPTFETGLAEWLAGELDLDVAVARDGEELRSGMVRIAPDGGHLGVAAGGVLAVDRHTPPRRGHRPSVDELFLSLARIYPRYVAAVLLTGMGHDGVEGMLRLSEGGALTFVQDQASCAVFGMPRAALEAGAATLALPPDEIGHLIGRIARGEESG